MALLSLRHTPLVHSLGAGPFGVARNLRGAVRASPPPWKWAAELVAGLLQVKADALVLGDQTYGKGSIQSSFRAFSDDCMALITIGWYLLPPDSDDDTDDWRFVDRAKAPNTWGVEPNVFVPMSVAETDAAMKARTQWFSGIGRDQKQPSDTEVPDPTIQLALALIRARVLNLQ